MKSSPAHQTQEIKKQAVENLTPKQVSLSRRYLYYRFCSHLFFITAVWLYLYRFFITDQQIGVLDGMAFAIGLLAEVPSGALADKFGRDRLARLGLFLFGMGFLIQAGGSSFMPFFVGQAILMIGASFQSGADEALFFEELGFDRESTHWRKLATRGSQVMLIAGVISTVLAGFLYTLNPRYPWVLTGFSMFAAMLIIWPVRDTRSRSQRKAFKAEVKDYLVDIKIGFAQFRLPQLRLYIPIIIFVQGLFYTIGWGLLRIILLDRFHFSPVWGSIVVATSSLLTVGLLAYMHAKADKISEKQIITLISASAAASLLLSVANIGVWGFAVIFVLYAGEHLLYPYMSEILNIHAPKDQRATVLSVANFMRMLPYVILAPIIGALNTQGNLSYFLIVWSVLIGLALLWYLSKKRQDTRLKTVSGA